MDNEKMINCIRVLCKNNNISPSKLEEELGFSQGLISRWKDKTPSLDKIVDIANYFNVSIDDIVGYNNINDVFLEKLISQTSNKDIQWNAYNDKSNEPKQNLEFPLQFNNFVDEDDIYEFINTHKELSYFCMVGRGFISLYANYEYENVINPNNIKLFIQPDQNASLIEQKYDYEQLKILWLKVIYTMEEHAPDEIKAEELKNIFINGANSINDNHIKIDDKDIALNKIIYIEQIGQELCVIYLDGKNEITTNNTIQNLFVILEKYEEFAHPHYRYIINIKKIKYLTNKSITLIGDYQIPISVSIRRKNFNENKNINKYA